MKHTMMGKTPVELLSAIVLAAVLISGSLVFLGWQLRPRPDETAPAIDRQQLKQDITAEVLAEIQKKQDAADGDTLAAEAVPALDTEELRAEILAEVQNADFIDPIIDAGIQRYIAKQQEAQAEAREAQARQAEEKARNVPPLDPENDHIYGNPDALITLIEYSDFECPFCKTYHPNPKQVVDESDGTVNLVYRHYPLAFHNPGAQKQAEASECAAELGGNDAFWQYADAIYERTTSNGQGFPLENLVPLAEEIGLDAEAFRECVDSDRYAQYVKDQMSAGAASGITGTPGTIIRNNETGEVRLASGALPVAQIHAKIQELLPQE